ncbi:MAG: putative manganese-dependent inorganic diphosphatase [Tissierellia bacterium]|jgi:manganese-dependent inorganic pyrophosphatase|nr:putative manganese-dependent inorganic diphosphatase [Tissierellia bacterium]
MKDRIYITGHKNPDTDSICAALAYADYKSASGDVEAIPVRLGDINLETRFILNYFGVEAPKLIETVRLSVSDLSFDKVAPISSGISLRMALSLMKKNNLNSLPVVDGDEKLIGMVTISDIIQNYIDVWDSTVLGRAGTSLDNIIDTLNATSVYLPKNPRKMTGKVSIFAMDIEKIKENDYEDCVAICGRDDIQEFAIKSNVALMIVTGNGQVDEELIKLAEENNTSIITTPYDTFMTSRLITQSIPVSYCMTKDDIVRISIDDLVDDAKVKMSQSRYRAYPVVDGNNRVVGLLSRYHLITSMKKKVILVDHNERSQSIDGLEESEILEIIDHHRIGDVLTGNPIYFRNEPVGSTSTIIASIFFENGRVPSKKIAGILAAAIISDTLLLKSPTATYTDKIILERLSRIAGIDIEKFADEMFKAGTSLTGLTPKELLNQDFKSFAINEAKIGISQVYTMDAASLNDIRDDLIKLMEEIARDSNYFAFILMLTDILNETSEMIVVSDHKDIIADAFNSKLENNSFYAPGVLSRKKQVIPPLTEALANME